MIDSPSLLAAISDSNHRHLRLSHLGVVGPSPFYGEKQACNGPGRLDTTVHFDNCYTSYGRRDAGRSIRASETSFSSDFPRGCRGSSRPGFWYTFRGRCSPRLSQYVTPFLMHKFPFRTGL